MTKVTTSATDEGAMRVYTVVCPHGTYTRHIPTHPLRLRDEGVWPWIAGQHRKAMPCTCSIAIWARLPAAYRRRRDEDDADE